MFANRCGWDPVVWWDERSGVYYGMGACGHNTKGGMTGTGGCVQSGPLETERMLFFVYLVHPGWHTAHRLMRTRGETN